MVEKNEDTQAIEPRDESRDVWVFDSRNGSIAVNHETYSKVVSGTWPFGKSGEHCVPYSQLEAALADVARLKAALNSDRTGLAAALVRVNELCAGYSWIPDGEWGSYDYTQQTKETLRKEVGNCLDAIHDVAMAALKASGDVATRAIRNEPSDSELLDVILEAQPLDESPRCCECGAPVAMGNICQKCMLKPGDPGVAEAPSQPRDESRDVFVYEGGGTLGVTEYAHYLEHGDEWNVDGERYVPYAELEVALGKCSGCGGDNCSRMWREQKKCCPDCKCEVTDSVLLDDILEAFENPRSEALYDALQSAIVERAKR